MENYFKPSEFIISEYIPVPQDVMDKIHLNFILPLNEIREKLGKAIVVSKRSGYRPTWWEYAHGRSGGSEHTFSGKGAADLTTVGYASGYGFDSAFYDLVDLLVKKSPFTRVAHYKTFVHVDYKHPIKNEVLLYDATSGKWLNKKVIKR